MSTSRTRRLEPGRYEHRDTGWIVLDFYREYGHGWGWIAFDPNPTGNPWGSAFDPAPTKAQILDQLDEALRVGHIKPRGHHND